MSKQPKKWLTPTKKPSLSMNVLTPHDINYSSLNATIVYGTIYSSKTKQQPQKMIENILKGNSDLRQLSSTENLFHREGSNKSSNLSLINNKIDSILSSYNKIKTQKGKFKPSSREKIKRSKENKQNKIVIASRPKKLEKQKDLFQQISNKKTQITALTLNDININQSQFKRKERHNKMLVEESKDYPGIPAILIPKSSKPSKQNLVINKPYEDQNSKMANFSLQLEELQISEQYIDNLLTTLEKDFLPKNTDYFVYNQEQIKLPKIFRKSRKSKANIQMYKSCTEVDNKIKDSSIEVFKSVLIEKSTIRKGSMSQSLSLIERQLNNFLMGLKTQIGLDSQFKKMKEWFLFSKIQDKWKKLEKQLKINNLWVNQLTMKVIFLYQNQEGTLFQSVYQQEFSIKQLVITFRTAQQHWSEYILNKFDAKLIRGAGFTENVLDSSKKGYISIEDLIRFLHCKLKQFYYTRDLNMIYLRLKGGQKLQYEEIMAKISSNCL